MTIRPATETDFDEMWRIFQAVVATGDTYVFAADTSREDAREYFLGPGVTSFVAELDGRVAGMYKLIPNRRDRGSHVANASYMVHPSCYGKGVGRHMGLHSLHEARARGFLAMQFNFVVSTNTRAVKLWQSLGFAIVGTLPKVFRHRDLGDVDAFVMYRSLEEVPAAQTHELPIFGTRLDGYPYVVRPSAYALVRNGRREVAVVDTVEGVFLPGGGIDDGESAAQAAVRETREECALDVRLGASVGEAVEIVLSAKECTCFEKRSTFFAADIIGSVEQAPEHPVRWLLPEAAVAQLSRASHIWAVRRLVEGDGSTEDGEDPWKKCLASVACSFGHVIRRR